MNINDMVSLCMHVCANDNANVHVKSRTTKVVHEFGSKAKVDIIITPKKISICIGIVNDEYQ